MTEQTPEPTTAGNQVSEEKDMQERIAGFNKELLPLLGKYELGLAAMPKIMQDGRVVADPIIVSVRGRAQQTQQATNTPGPNTGLVTE